MYVRMRVGRYAGEVRDVAAEQAHALIKAGLAADERDERREPAKNASFPAPAPAPEASDSSDSSDSAIHESLNSRKPKRKR